MVCGGCTGDAEPAAEENEPFSHCLLSPADALALVLSEMVRRIQESDALMAVENDLAAEWNRLLEAAHAGVSPPPPSAHMANSPGWMQWMQIMDQSRQSDRQATRTGSVSIVRAARAQVNLSVVCQASRLSVCRSQGAGGSPRRGCLGAGRATR